MLKEKGQILRRAIQDFGELNYILTVLIFFCALHYRTPWSVDPLESSLVHRTQAFKGFKCSHGDLRCT